MPTTNQRRGRANPFFHLYIRPQRSVQPFSKPQVRVAQHVHRARRGRLPRSERRFEPREAPAAQTLQQQQPRGLIDDLRFEPYYLLKNGPRV